MSATNPPSTPTNPPAETEPDRVHVSILLDRSGSMASVVDDTIGGFNTFVDQQKKLPGECRMTLVQFDSQDPHEVVFDAIPPREVMPLTDRTYQPRGGTPLLDAVGTLIQRLDKRVAVDPGEDQLVAIITDGYENSSGLFSKEEVAGMITLRGRGDWTFLFLGADIDAFGEAGGIGIDGGRAGGYDRSGDGLRMAFSDVSASARALRSMDRAERRTKKDRLLADAREEREQSEEHD